MSTNESFLSRWSRRKHDSRIPDGDPKPAEARGEAAPEPAKRAAPPPAVSSEAARAVVPGMSPGPVEAAPATDPAPADSSAAASREPAAAGRRSESRAIELPSIDSLTPQSDFRPFMQAGVDAATRNAALAQLFRDPHFNVMDGLDVYIDDYNKTEPIPPAMLAKLRQLHSIGLSDEEIERRTADDDDARETPLAQADEAQRPASDAAAADELPGALIRVAQAGPTDDETRREDAAADGNAQETGGEDEGSRM